MMPKSSSGPPGLWLAVKMKPPNAFMYEGPRSRITAETAGVDNRPPCMAQARTHTGTIKSNIENVEMSVQLAYKYPNSKHHL